MKILYLFFSFLAFTSIANAEPLTQSYEKLYSLDNQILGLNKAGTLDLLEVKNNQPVVKKSIPFTDYVWAAAEGKSKIALATGMRRDDLGAPTKVTLYSKNLDTPEVIFEKQGERNQPAFLKEVQNTWWFGYFDSKYITKLGTLDPQNKSFKEFFSTRVGDAIDVITPEMAFVGRAYGDVLGQDGDVSLVKSGTATLLPTYRGVRALKALGSDPTPPVVIADGWHQNYGQFAQGRISLLSFDKVTSRYQLSLLYKDPAQYGFSKIEQCGDSGIVALGDKALMQLKIGPTNQLKIVTSRPSDAEPLDFALVNKTAAGCTVAYAFNGKVEAARLD